jgi:hypothetical protein
MAVKTEGDVSGKRSQCTKKAMRIAETGKKRSA